MLCIDMPCQQPLHAYCFCACTPVWHTHMKRQDACDVPTSWRAPAPKHVCSRPRAFTCIHTHHRRARSHACASEHMHMYVRAPSHMSARTATAVSVCTYLRIHNLLYKSRTHARAPKHKSVSAHTHVCSRRQQRNAIHTDIRLPAHATICGRVRTYRYYYQHV